MKLLTASILFIYGIFSLSNSKDVPQILEKYMEWTQTGKTCLGNSIFDAKVNLTYQVRAGEFESTPFHEYLSKVEHAAASVTRSMAVAQLRVFGNKATAYLSDVSLEGDFTLIHQLSLRKRKYDWRIKAIKIIDAS